MRPPDRSGVRWWHDRWARHLVASLERRLQVETCAHDGTGCCPLCRLVVSVGFLPAPARRPADR